jgi:uncharacterized protein YndB with AHSA1/START domain
MTTDTSTTVRVHRVYIKASAQAIWDAITQPEWAVKYGYQSPVEYDLRPGGAYKGYASEPMKAMGVPEVAIEGEIIEADPPRKLVQTWHPVWDPETAKEAPTRLTYEIEEGENGVSSLTLTHDLTGAPSVAAMVSGQVPGAGGGWAEVLSDLKTLLETGKSMHE